MVKRTKKSATFEGKSTFGGKPVGPPGPWKQTTLGLGDRAYRVRAVDRTRPLTVQSEIPGGIEAQFRRGPSGPWRTVVNLGIRTRLLEALKAPKAKGTRDFNARVFVTALGYTLEDWGLKATDVVRVDGDRIIMRGKQVRHLNSTELGYLKGKELSGRKPKRTARRKQKPGDGWISVSKPHRSGRRKYRYRRKGPRAEVHFQRDGTWYTVRNQSVLDYFFAMLEGRAAKKWPYEASKAKAERKTKSEQAALAAAIRRAK